MTDLRELLILVLALLILFSLLRAVFVILRRRRGQIRLSIDKSIAQSMELEQSEEDEFDELPNGGARPVAARSNGKERKEDSAAATAGGALDGVAGVDAGESVPMLTDVVAIAPLPAQQPQQPQQGPRPARQRQRKPNWKAEIRDAHSTGFAGAELSSKTGRKAELDLDAVSMTAGERIGVEPAKNATTAANHVGAAPPEPETIAPETIAKAGAAAKPLERAQPPPPTREAEPRRPIQEPEPLRLDAEEEPEAADISPDQIIALHVVASEGETFAGRETWDFLLAASLRYDDRKVFSKFDGSRDDADPVFRVANLVNPGTFDAGNIEQFSTPGISLFMLLPAPIDNMRAFEQMLKVAQGFAGAFGGHLLDSQRRELTPRLIEAIRRRIREFEVSAYGPSPMSSRL